MPLEDVSDLMGKDTLNFLGFPGFLQKPSVENQVSARQRKCVNFS